MWLRFFRLSRLGLHLIAGLWVLLRTRTAETSLPINDALIKKRRRWLARSTDILGLDIIVLGKPLSQTCVMVANHVSWLDILTIGSTTDASFLSKEEISRWPLIGQLAKKSGTLFIARGQRDAMQRARDRIKQYLNNHFSVIFFPEGTTTDGHNVKKFHSPLFSVAVDTTLPVQPIAIHYPDHQHDHNRVAFIDDDAFVTHAWRLLAYPRIPVVIHFLPAINTHNKTTRQLAQLTQTSIQANLQQPLHTYITD